MWYDSGIRFCVLTLWNRVRHVGIAWHQRGCVCTLYLSTYSLVSPEVRQKGRLALVIKPNHFVVQKLYERVWMYFDWAFDVLVVDVFGPSGDLPPRSWWILVKLNEEISFGTSQCFCTIDSSRLSLRPRPITIIFTTAIFCHSMAHSCTVLHIFDFGTGWSSSFSRISKNENKKPKIRGFHDLFNKNFPMQTSIVTCNAYFHSN